MPIIDRAQFKSDAKHGGFIGSLQLDDRTATTSVRSSTGDFEAVWAIAEAVLRVLRDDMAAVVEAVRELFSGLSTLDEDTPRTRRKIERMLGQLGASDVTCRINDSGAEVYFDQPRLTDHQIELRFIGSKLVYATLAG